jgi:hypothetical protein
MWEDFMRGNWPAPAAAEPAVPQSPQGIAAPAMPREYRPAGVTNYAGVVHAEAVRSPVRTRAAHAAPRPATRTFTVRAVAAAGAGLLLAFGLPGSAVASPGHATSHGAHTAVAGTP